MAYFKVKSVTNKLAKRHIFYNAVLDVEINAKFDQETHKLGAGREIVINAENLPLSVHKLRAKKLVEVIKISESSYQKQEAAKTNAGSSTLITPQLKVIIPTPFSESNDEDDDDEVKKNRKRNRKY